MNTMQKTVVNLFAVLLLLVSASSFADKLVSTVDRSEITVDETLTLQVRYTGNGQGKPDFGAIKNNFEILNQSESNQYRSINGVVEAFTEWSLTLFPKKPGRLIIPSFKHHGQFSETIEIRANESRPLPSGQKDVVFLETIVDVSSAHVQEQVILTYRFYYSVNVDGLERDDISLNDVLIEELPRTNFQKNVNGVPYNVAEFQYTLFPQTSGTLQIPALTWTAKLSFGQRRSRFDLNPGRFELKRLRTEAKTLQVQPQPQEYPSDATWLPSQNVTIEENWTKDPTRFKVGEPITRTVTLHAQGLMASQLPKLTAEPTDTRLKFYADQPTLNDEKNARGFAGERTETVAVVVSEGGEIVVPEISVPWWDTKTNQLRYAKLPERRFLVAAANDEAKSNQTAREKALEDGATSTMQPPEPTTAQPSNTRLWQWLTLCFALISFILALQCRHLHKKLKRALKQTTLAPNHKNNLAARNESDAWRQFQRACENNNPAEVRTSLLLWGKSRWPNAQIHALADIARAISSDDINQQLQTLDQALYAEAKTQWHANNLLNTLANWRKKSLIDSRKKTTELTPLYG